AFLPRIVARHRSGERHWTGAVHCAFHRSPPRWRCFCRKRRRRPGQHVHASPAEGLSRMSAARILVVEDESHIAQGLRFNLEAEGYSVELTARGEDALKFLLDERKPFDLLVLDVMLPGKDGFTVARELRTAQNFIP